MRIKPWLAAGGGRRRGDSSRVGIKRSIKRSSPAAKCPLTCLLHLKRGNFSTRRGNSSRGFSPLPPSPPCSQALFGKSPGKVPTAARLHTDWKGKPNPSEGH